MSTHNSVCTPNQCPHRHADPADPKRRAGCPAPQPTRVVYAGPLDAPVVIVGSAPLLEEAEGAQPQYSNAYRLLFHYLREGGWDTDNLLLTHAVHCPAPPKSPPKKKQIDLCREHTWAILGAYPRRLILCLGNEAWSCLWKCKASGVMSGMGTFRQHEFGMTLWMLHPAAAVRAPELEPVLERTLARAHRYYVDGERPALPDLDWLLLHPDHCNPWADAETLAGLYGLTPGPEDKLVIDTETSGTDPYRDTLLGVGIYFTAHQQAVYVALNHGNPPVSVWSAEDSWKILDLLRAWLTAPGQKIIQNVNFDVSFLYEQLHLDLLPLAFDTLVEANLTDENSLKGLKERAMALLGAPAWDRIWEDEKGRTISDYAESAGLHLGMAPVEEVGKYCCLDCFYTYALHEKYQGLMTPAQRELEARFLRPQMNQLLRIGRRGVLADVASIQALGEALDGLITETAAEVNRRLGTTGKRFTSDKHAPLGLNLGSVPQRQHLLFSLLRLGAFVPRTNKEFVTDTGALSTSAAVVDFLLGHAVVPEEAKAVLRLVKLYGKLTDMRSDFVHSILEKVRPYGTVHAEFTQWVTRTGRLSCKRPNLQQVPKLLRPFFMAPAGYTFVDADYSEIEVRCWAELSRDPLLMKALSEEPDFHRFTVGMALGKAPEQVTDEERQRGKVLTFGGTMYRGGAPVIAKSMGIPMDRAQDLFDNIQALYSRGAAWMDHQIEFCRRHGYVQSPLGRIRRLPGICSVEKGTRTEAERQSVNCLRGDSLILTEDGYQQLDTLTDGVKVWDGSAFSPALLSGPTEKPEVCLRLSNHREIFCSPDHKFLVDGSWVAASELRPDDDLTPAVAVAPGGHTPSLAPGWEERCAWTTPCAAPMVKCTVPSVIDDEVAYLLGYMVGNGCYGTNDHSCSVVIGAQHEDVIETIGCILKSHFELSRPPKLKLRNGQPSSWTYALPTKVIRFLCDECGLDRHTAADKAFPEWALSAALRTRRALLSGYFDADGGTTVGNGHFQPLFTTVSRRLALQTVELLESVGLHSVLRNFPSQRRAWRVLVHGSSLSAFRDRLSLRSARKRTVIELGAAYQGLYRKGDKGRARARVVSAETTGRTVPMWDLTVPGVEQFCVEGVICHNSCIQGLASDLTGLAALRAEALWQQEGIDGWIAVLVHDSIVTIVRDDQVEKAAALLVEEMCRPPYTQWVVPLRAKTSISKRWNGELDINAVLAKLGAAQDEEDDDA